MAYLDHISTRKINLPTVIQAVFSIAFFTKYSSQVQILRFDTVYTKYDEIALFARCVAVRLIQISLFQLYIFRRFTVDFQGSNIRNHRSVVTHTINTQYYHII